MVFWLISNIGRFKMYSNHNAKSQRKTFKALTLNHFGIYLWIPDANSRPNRVKVAV